MGLLNRLAPRRGEHGASNGASSTDPAFGTKALQKFLSSLTSRESPVLLDLGPVVGSNLSFFGEQLGCKIRVEDIFADIDRHVNEGRAEALPDFLAKRLSQADGVVDGILCWDVIDYLDRPSAQALAKELTRVLRPDGALLAFFGTVPAVESRYTKFVIVDELTLRYRPYAAARGRQAVLVNRDIIRLFPGMRVSDSFLLQNNIREILFRKSPSAA
jgi:SAM-dependent methyltransferase